MIFLNRRRLFVWLIKAYVRKWRKTIILSFVLGFVVFFLLYLFLKLFQPTLSINKKVIGLVGSYSTESLPNEVLDRVSYGLTAISSDGRPVPSVASSWSVKDNGKIYTFKLRDNIYFSDKSKLTSGFIDYNFENVTVERPNEQTITFKLKESYSPFLITVSKPIIKKGFIGLGSYKIKSLDLNGEFVNTMELSPIKPGESLTYQFYPTEEALKTALILGEITQTPDISNLSLLNSNFKEFKNYQVDKRTNYNKLVALFYDIQDKSLSDKRLREALDYALPDSFEQGQRNQTPYPPTLWVSQEDALRSPQDIEHAKLLLKQSQQASGSAKINLNIKTFPRYEKVAEDIVKEWKKLGIQTTVAIVDSFPSEFQIFLGEFNVSKDPDQYVLWHSSQPGNITKYKNLRIDKLLEDGRQISNSVERQKIYSDFQKYLLDDPPASFLYFPYYYTISKN